MTAAAIPRRVFKQRRHTLRFKDPDCRKEILKSSALSGETGTLSLEKAATIRRELNKFRRLLDALIVLAVVLALPIFWLMEKVIESRKHGGDDDKKNLRRNIAVAEDDSPPTEPPFQASMSGACCPIQHLVEKRKEAKG